MSIRRLLVLVAAFSGLMAGVYHWTRWQNSLDFCHAVRRGDFDKAIGCMERGADPNYRCAKGVPAVVLASFSGNPRLITALATRGADVEATRVPGAGTPLMAAASSGKVESVETLIQLGARPNSANGEGKTALMVAAAKGHGACVRALLNGNANPVLKDRYGDTAIDWALSGNHLNVAKILRSAALRWNLAPLPTQQQPRDD